MMSSGSVVPENPGEVSLGDSHGARNGENRHSGAFGLASYCFKGIQESSLTLQVEVTHRAGFLPRPASA